MLNYARTSSSGGLATNVLPTAAAAFIQPRSTTAVLLVLLLLSVGPALSFKTCYSPGGDNRNGPYDTPSNSTYLPCNPTDGTASMCCATHDTCMPNGLCWNNAYHCWWRESCTDPDFTDPNCVKLFIDQDEDITVSNCTDGSWCLVKEDNPDCCSDHTGEFLVANNDTIPAESRYNASATSLPSTTSATSTSGSMSSPSASATSSHSSLSTGAKVGIGVGVGVVAAVFLILSLIYLRLRHRRRQGPSYSQPPSDVTRREELPAPVSKHLSPSSGSLSSVPQEKYGSRLRTNVAAEME